MYTGNMRMDGDHGNPVEPAEMKAFYVEFFNPFNCSGLR